MPDTKKPTQLKRAGTFRPSWRSAVLRGALFALVLSLLGEKNIVRLILMAALFAAVAYSIDHAFYVYKNRKEQK